MQNKKSNFNQALWLAISYICSMMVGIFSSVVLSRYFDKIQYGTYKQIIHIYNLLLIVFQAGIPMVFTYFLPRYSRAEGAFIVKKIQKILFILGICFSITLFLSSDLISQLMNNLELAVGLKIFSFFPLFTLPTLGVEGIYTVNKKTRFIAFYSIITRLVMLGCIIFPVIFIKNDFKIALIGWGVASFVAFIIAVIAKNKAYADVNVKEITGLTKEVFYYSLPIMISSVIRMLFNFASQFYISRYYGTESFAEYSNGNMTLPFAVMFIAPVRAILTPIFSKSSKDGNYNNAVKTLYSSINQVAILMIPLIIFSFCFAKEIMIFLYGDKYENSFIYFRIMIIFNFIEIFVFSGILSAIGKTKIEMFFTIICTIVLWILDFILIKLPLSSPYIIAGSFVFMNSIVYYVMPGMYLKLKNKISVVNINIIINIIKIILHCSAICIMTWIIMAFAKEYVNIFCYLGVAFLLFYIMLYFTSKIIDVKYLEAISKIVKR